MSARIKKHLACIMALPKLSSKMRRALIHNMSDDFVRCLCELCLNVIKRNVPMTKVHKSKLSRHKRIVRKLAAKTKSVYKKKKYLVQKGGSFIPLLLSIVAPVISKLLG